MIFMADYVQGDTVWLRASFYDRDGVLYDPVSVSLKLYDSGRVQIGTTYTTAIAKVAVGIYECAVTLPSKTTVVGEWTGVDSNSNAHIVRGEVHPEWAADATATVVDYLKAENISIADSGSKFTATDVEGALAELEARVAALE